MLPTGNNSCEHKTRIIVHYEWIFVSRQPKKNHGHTGSSSARVRAIVEQQSRIVGIVGMVYAHLTLGPNVTERVSTFLQYSHIR